MPQANIVEQVVIFDDVENESNPQRKHIDWKRSATGLTLDEVFSERLTLGAGISKTLEASVGASDLSATACTMGAAAGKSTWYQVRGAYASPWAAALGTAGQNVTVTANLDGTISLSGAGLAALTNVRPGDQVYLSGSDYGDTGAFASANQGFWSVVSLATGLTLQRVFAEDTQGTSEVVAVAANLDIQHIADSTRPRWAFIRGGVVFAGVKAVLAAASGWFAVATETQFTPTAAYTFSKLVVAPRYISFVRIEADQPVKVSIGDAGAAANEVNLIPLAAAAPAWYEAFAFGTSLAVLNDGGPNTAIINVVYAVKE